MSGEPMGLWNPNQSGSTAQSDEQYAPAAPFFYLPTVTTDPVAAPATATYAVAACFNTANNKLWVYNGGWKSVTLA